MDKHSDQISRVYKAFLLSPMTMKEADVFTGIMRESICRYVSKLKKQGKIELIKKRYCRITRHLAGEYTTDPKKFPQRPKQQTLF